MKSSDEIYHFHLHTTLLTQTSKSKGSINKYPNLENCKGNVRNTRIEKARDSKDNLYRVNSINLRILTKDLFRNYMCFLNLPTFFCGESVMVVIRKYIEQVGGQLYGRVYIFRDFDPHPVHENLKQDMYISHRNI